MNPRLEELRKRLIDPRVPSVRPWQKLIAEEDAPPGHNAPERVLEAQAPTVKAPQGAANRGLRRALGC